MVGEELFFELALEDLRLAADLFRPIYDQTHGIDGWVSLNVSPFLLSIFRSRLYRMWRQGRRNQSQTDHIGSRIK